MLHYTLYCCTIQCTNRNAEFNINGITVRCIILFDTSHIQLLLDESSYLLYLLIIFITCINYTHLYTHHYIYLNQMAIERAMIFIDRVYLLYPSIAFLNYFYHDRIWFCIYSNRIAIRWATYWSGRRERCIPSRLIRLASSKRRGRNPVYRVGCSISWRSGAGTRWEQLTRCTLGVCQYSMQMRM